MSKIEELRDLMKRYEGINACLYTPIVIDGNVLYEGNRKHSNQFRFDYIDVKDKIVCDLGCNNGYSSSRFAENGAKRVIGIEKDPIIAKVAKLVADVKNLPNVEIFQGTYQDYFDHRQHPEHNLEFDVVVFTSEQDYRGVCTVLDCAFNPDEYLINTKTWYIEPTNHPDHKLSKEEIKEWGETELSKYGDVEFLTFTDYQNRGLFKINVNTNN